MRGEREKNRKEGRERGNKNRLKMIKKAEKQGRECDILHCLKMNVEFS